MPVDEVSIGDYVLVGGEVAVLVIVEAVARLLPGVLGNPRPPSRTRSPTACSKGPSYTRPEVWRGLAVPDVLRSGNHALIDRWRRDQALERTFQRRPDLLDACRTTHSTAQDRAVLDRLPTQAGLTRPDFAASPPASGTLNRLLPPGEWPGARARSRSPRLVVAESALCMSSARGSTRRHVDTRTDHR